MCGIVCAIGVIPEAIPLVKQGAILLRPRGPDAEGLWSDVCGHTKISGLQGTKVEPLYAACAHTRLAIVDVINGDQPFIRGDEQDTVFVTNGEIVNYAALKKPADTLHTKSDSEVLFVRTCEVLKSSSRRDDTTALLNSLEGMFAFTTISRDVRAIDKKCVIPQSYKFLVARDAVGIIPLYWGKDEYGGLWFASEAKSISHLETIQTFPPGHYLDETCDGVPKRWWNVRDFTNLSLTNTPYTPSSEIRQRLEQSVVDHLLGDVPFGVLLSGGLDSTSIAALAVQHSERRVDDGTKAWYPNIHTFSIGMKGSPDLESAAYAARELGTIHHPFTFTFEEVLANLNNVIYAIETYDTTTIRASIPLYLLGKRLRRSGIKVVLSGEGADELFGGYLYFRAAPGTTEFQKELVSKVELLHKFDCLRANKALAASGVECRVPFLTRSFVEYALSIDPKEKLCSTRIEKVILRDAMKDLLPEGVYLRQKEQFSDGVGYSFIDSLQKFAASKYSKREFAAAAAKYHHNTPRTPEELLYREIFTDSFGKKLDHTVEWGASVACSTHTASKWMSGKIVDPSGRAAAHHSASYERSIE